MHVGDAVLGQLGELVRQRLPPGGFGSRISGDRFVLLLPAAVAEAERFAEALRTGAERLSLLQAEARTPVSISVGVALLDAGADDLAHVLVAAETACKAAKDRGRNRVEIYEQSDVSIVRRFADIGIAEKLRGAIEEGRLHLDAQLILPFAAAESARPHYELLLRMTDEQRQARRSRQFSLGRDPLPDDAGDRSLGGQSRHRSPAAARRRARGPGARLRDQLLRPVPER